MESSSIHLNTACASPPEDFKLALGTLDKSVTYWVLSLEMATRCVPPAVIDILGLELDKADVPGCIQRTFTETNLPVGLAETIPSM
jgi:hypothetical protein